MGHAERMARDHAGTLPVIDFRRQSMILAWHVLGGTWTAYDSPPSLVHGVALIRPVPPNLCVYGHEGRLTLQVGADHYTLDEDSPRLKCGRGLLSFGLRRRFTVEAAGGGVLYSHSYWSSQGEDFFDWLAARAQDPKWRATAGRLWSEGLAPSKLRAT
jgi:hypothetical protein